MNYHFNDNNLRPHQLKYKVHCLYGCLKVCQCFFRAVIDSVLPRYTGSQEARHPAQGVDLTQSNTFPTHLFLLTLSDLEYQVLVIPWFFKGRKTRVSLDKIMNLLRTVTRWKCNAGPVLLCSIRMCATCATFHACVAQV